MFFRSMKISDTARVVELFRQVGRSEFKAPSKLWFATRLLLPTFHTFVIEDDNCRVIGAVVLNRLSNPKHNWRGYIDYVVVDEPFRGYGFGRRLMEGVLARAQALGCQEVLLSTSNPEARALYHSLGFEVCLSSSLMKLTPQIRRS